jgi:hypothetical protein
MNLFASHFPACLECCHKLHPDARGRHAHRPLKKANLGNPTRGGTRAMLPRRTISDLHAMLLNQSSAAPLSWMPRTARVVTGAAHLGDRAVMWVAKGKIVPYRGTRPSSPEASKCDARPINTPRGRHAAMDSHPVASGQSSAAQARLVVPFIASQKSCRTCHQSEGSSPDRQGSDGRLQSQRRQTTQNGCHRSGWSPICPTRDACALEVQSESRGCREACASLRRRTYEAVPNDTVGTQSASGRGLR